MIKLYVHLIVERLLVSLAKMDQNLWQFG